MTNQEIQQLLDQDQISLRELRRTGSVHGPRHKETVLALVEAVNAAQAVADTELKRNGFVPVELYEQLHTALARFKDYGQPVSEETA